jgi:hypothetical protein
MRQERKLKGMFNLTLTVLNVEHKSEGKTIEECFENIPLKWSEVKTRGDAKLTDGTRSCEHRFPLRILRRMMINPITRSLWARRLNDLMK